jgi:T-box protein 20
MKEDTVEEEDGESSLTDHEIDVEDIDDGDDGHHLTVKSGGVVLQRHRHQGSHSTIRSFKEEEEDDEDEVLDKEEIVDDDDAGGPLVGAVKSKKKSGKKSGKSSGSGSSGSSSSSNPQIKPKCNCEQLQLVDCHLETKELWDKFNELGTEMIITKTGRLVRVSALHKSICKTTSICNSPYHSLKQKQKESQTFHNTVVVSVALVEENSHTNIFFFAPCA